jgi:hypothetical protein
MSCRWGPVTHYRGFDITSENGTINLSAGRPYQGLFLINWTGIRYSRTLSAPKAYSNEGTTSIYFEWQAKDRCNLTIAYWTILWFIAVVWISGFAWWHFNNRRREKTSNK